MAHIDLNGYKMNVETIPGVLPMDTLFLHGNLASNTWWKPSLDLWKQLAKPGFEGRAVAAEWRGCGDSEAPRTEAELHPSALADDMIALCQTLGLKKVCIVGHSTGGLIALYAMLKAPALFDRAVLLDPVGATGAQFGPEMYEAFTQMSQSRDICQTVMNGTIHNNDVASSLFQKIVDDTFRVAKLNWHGVPRALHSLNLTSDLPKIQNPVLILHGRLDPIIPLESSQTLAAGLPNARLDIVENHGHSLNVEDPKTFVEKVNQFLFHRP